MSTEEAGPGGGKRSDIPERMRRFLAEEAPALAGACIAELPNFVRDTKFELTFVPLEGLPVSALQLEDLGLSLEGEDSTWLLLAHLDDDESAILVIDGNDEECPVFMWESDDAQFYPISPSLDALRDRLVFKDERLPIEVLRESLEAAKDCWENGDHEGVVRLLTTGLDGNPPGRQRLDGNQRLVPSAFNLLGLSCKELGRNAEAEASFENAVESLSTRGGLNLLALLEEDGRHRKVTDVAARMKLLYLDPYSAAWRLRYLGRAQLFLDEGEAARATFSQLAARFAERQPECVAAAAEDLRKLLGSEELDSEAVERCIAALDNGYT